jgi:hypothetical protein
MARVGPQRHGGVGYIYLYIYIYIYTKSRLQSSATNQVITTFFWAIMHHYSLRNNLKESIPRNTKIFELRDNEEFQPYTLN